MIIGIDARSLQNNAPSGVSRYTAGMIEALLTQDTDNEYRLFVNAATDIRPYLPQWNFLNVRWCVGRWPNKVLNSAISFLHWPTIDTLIGGCDVVWVPNAHFVALSPQVKMVVTVHDLSFLLQPDLLTVKKRWWHWFIGLQALCRRADRVVTVSETTRRDVQRMFGLPAQRVTTVYPGVDSLPAPVALADMHSQWQLPEKFLFHVATKEPRKNVIATIRALELLHANGHHTLGLVCAGAVGWKQAAVRRAIAASPVRSHIRVLPYITDAEKQALYQAAVAFVYPSFYEGFGFPPLEAMAAGCPVVASVTGSLPEVCGAAAVLVDPHRPRDIAVAIEAILQDPDYRSRLIAAGTAQARQFSWAESARQLRSVFQQVCE